MKLNLNETQHHLTVDVHRSSRCKSIHPYEAYLTSGIGSGLELTNHLSIVNSTEITPSRRRNILADEANGTVAKQNVATTSVF